jgi:hypothetical protein
MPLSRNRQNQINWAAKIGRRSWFPSVWGDSEATSRLPKDWTRKNLQILLRVPVVHGVPGHPQVLATHVW